MSARAADPLAATLLERLQETTDLGRRDDWTRIAHREDSPTFLYEGRDIDPASCDVVVESVVHQVCDQNLHKGLVTQRARCTEVRVNKRALPLCMLAVGDNNITGDVSEVKGLPPFDPCFAAGQDKE